MVYNLYIDSLTHFILVALTSLVVYKHGDILFSLNLRIVYCVAINSLI